MPPVLRACIPFVLCVLVACSPSQTPNDAPKLAAAPQPPAKAVSQPPALAAIDPKEEKCTTEPRTDDNDTRPRCGGMGSAQPLPSHAYRIGPVQCPGGGHESITACDVSQPFTATVCGGMATIAHVPTGADGGTWSFKFQGAGGFAAVSYTHLDVYKRQRLADAGFGLWPQAALQDPPVGFDPWLAMAAVGYPLADRAAAVRAFHRHYRGRDDGEDPQASFDAEDLRILFALTNQRMAMRP